MDTKIETENGILDFLIVVAENLPLLVFAPLMIGLLAMVGAFALPQSYVSHSTLKMPTSPLAPTPVETALMMVSPQVLNDVIVTLKMYEARPSAVVLAELMRQVRATVSKDGMVRLDVTTPNPAQAQAISNAVIDRWLKAIALSERERVLLEQRRAYLMAAHDSIGRVMARLVIGDSSLQKSTQVGELNATVVLAADLQARYLDDILNINRRLNGLTRDDVVLQSPNLPTHPVAPNKGVIVIMSALVSAFLLLFWVFLRQAWRNMAQDPLGVQKQARLRAALGWKRK